MIATNQPDDVTYVTPDELERIADRNDVGVSDIGNRWYAVVVDRAADTARVFCAVKPASERAAS